MIDCCETSEKPVYQVDQVWQHHEKLDTHHSRHALQFRHWRMHATTALYACSLELE